MAFVTSFTGLSVTSSPTLTTSLRPSRPSPSRASRPTPTALFSDVVDDFMASSVHRQYISLACPTGEPPLQCIEGATADQPYALRTLKRQSELRYFQQPTSVKVHNFYEMRQAALSATHGCSHEEARVLAYPKMAAAYVLGQAEANKACSRYFEATTPTEIAMKRSVDNLYMKAVNPGGVFATACTDGQTKYEAYLMQVRGKSTEFRAKQYSAAQKAAMRFASTKQALTQKGHDCSYEETIFCKYPIVAASMRPTFGYYPPFVKEPTQGYTLGVARPMLIGNATIASAAAAAKMTYGVPVPIVV